MQEREKQFGTTDFAAGSMFGHRAFDLERGGWLRSPSFPVRFVPAENKAVCFKNQELNFRAFDLTSVHDVMDQHAEFLRSMTGLHVATKDCVCGYYAYYLNQATIYESPIRVTSVIEGYGRVVVGTRGFKCAKARLVAVVKPLLHGLWGLPVELWAEFEERYDVPVYPTKKDMLEAHPLSEPEVEPEEEIESPMGLPANSTTITFTSTAPPITWTTTRMPFTVTHPKTDPPKVLPPMPDEKPKTPLERIQEKRRKAREALARGLRNVGRSSESFGHGARSRRGSKP